MHFTYQKATGDLHQGDVLQRTPALDELLTHVHPHYNAAKYLRFIVLTQSCELVRRTFAEGAAPVCKTRYITIAAVRSFAEAVSREVAKHQRSERERRARYCSDRAREAVSQFVERLLNNNQPGYFYLHPDAESQVPERCVAFLALSIPVRGDLHYQTLLDSRVAQLRPEFQAKIGELVGNIYGRVGTTDWYENIGDDFEKMVDEITDSLCAWVPDKLMDRISREEKRRKKENPAYLMNESDLAEYVAKLVEERETRRHDIARAAGRVLSEFMPGVSDEDVERFTASLVNDQNFLAVAK